MGHLIRHNPFITNVMKGRINGRKGKKRPRKTFVEEMIEMAVWYSHMKTLALKREDTGSIFSLRQDLAFRKRRRRRLSGFFSRHFRRRKVEKKTTLGDGRCVSTGFASV